MGSEAFRFSVFRIETGARTTEWSPETFRSIGTKHCIVEVVFLSEFVANPFCQHSRYLRVQSNTTFGSGSPAVSSNGDTRHVESLVRQARRDSDSHRLPAVDRTCEPTRGLPRGCARHRTHMIFELYLKTRDRRSAGEYHAPSADVVSVLAPRNPNRSSRYFLAFTLYETAPSERSVLSPVD